MVRPILCGVVENIGQKDTDGNRPLVTTNDGTADPLWGAFGLVHGDEGGDEADTEASEEAADDKSG